MGPRRMDGFARPVGAAGAQPQPRPRPVAAAPMQPRMAPQPAQRPAQPLQRPVQPAQRSMQRPAAPQGYYEPQQAVQRSEAPQPAAAKGGGWRVLLQFVVGILVIAGVAAAIVALYIRYYQ